MFRGEGRTSARVFDFGNLKSCLTVTCCFDLSASRVPCIWSEHRHAQTLHLRTAVTSGPAWTCSVPADGAITSAATVECRAQLRHRGRHASVRELVGRRLQPGFWRRPHVGAEEVWTIGFAAVAEIEGWP